MPRLFLRSQKKVWALFFLFSFFQFSSLFADIPLEAQGDFQKAVALRNAGDFSESEKFFRKALTFDPSNSQIHFELANLYVAAYDSGGGEAQGSPLTLQKAVRELEAAAMFAPDFIPAQFNLGVVYKRLGDYEKAREQFRLVLKKASHPVPVLIQIAATYEGQNFFEEAKDYYIQALDIEPQNQEVRWALEELKNKKESSHRDQRMQTLGRWNQMAGNSLGGSAYDQISRTANTSSYQDEGSQSLFRQN